MAPVFLPERRQGVPLSKVAETLRAIRALADKYNIKDDQLWTYRRWQCPLSAPVINPEIPEEVRTG